MPKPSNNQSNKRRPQSAAARDPILRISEGLPADVEEYGEDLAALEEADGEEINIGHPQKKDIAELNAMAKEMEVENFGTMRKHEMIFQILRKHAENRGAHCRRAGNLARRFRLPPQSALQLFALSRGCVRVAFADSTFDLQTGDQQGRIRPPKEKEKFFALPMVDKVGDEEPEKAKDNH